MLSLREDCSCDEAHTPPKYIQLTIGHNIIGRGYKSDVKLLNYAWLSRKHLNITKVDSPHFLESFGKTGVFVNRRKVNFKVLNEGDIVTIGGGSNDLPVGSGLPDPCGPYIEYTYSYQTKIENKENIYKDPLVNPDELLSLEEVINGRITKETYHLQDFETTLDAFDIDIAQTVLADVSVKVPSKIETMPPKRPVRIKKPRKDLDMVYNVTNPANKKGNKLSSMNTSATLSGTNSITEVDFCSSKTLPKATTSLNDSIIINSNNSDINTENYVNNKSDSKASINNLQVSNDMKNNTNVILEDSKAVEQNTKKSKKKRISGLKPLLKPDNKPTGLNESKKIKASATISKPFGTDASATSATPDTKEEDEDEAWAMFNRTALFVDKTVEFIDQKISERDKTNSEIKGNTTHGSSSALSENDCKKTKEYVPLTVNGNNKKLILKSPLKSPIKGKRPKRTSRALGVNYYGWSHSEDEDDAELESVHSTCSSTVNKIEKPKKGKKRKVSIQAINKTYEPDVDKNDELPDVDGVGCSNVEELIDSEKRGKRKSDESSDGPAKKKAKTGTGVKGKGKKKKGKIRDPEQQTILNQWKRLPKKTMEANFVEVLNGKYRRALYGFEDSTIFKVTYKKQENQPATTAHYWDSEEYDVVVKIDMTSLEDRLLAGTLIEDDKSRVFRIVKKQMKRANMKDYDKPKILVHDYVTQQPPEIKLDMKQYQLNALGWMKRLEDRVDRGFVCTKLVQWNESGLDLGFDVVNKRVFVPPLPVSKNTVLTVKSKGGILADQMGLGKTITLLGLIASNRATFPKIPNPRKFNYQENFSLPTGATLVVAPSHLTGQWKDEVESHTEDMNVLVITTKFQFEKLTYVDILEADVVVVSVQFLLTNKVFTTMSTGIGCETDFMQLMRKSGVNPLLQNAPNLMHFKWWRIIADEAHEIMTYDPKHVKTGRGKSQNATPGSQGLQVLEKFPSFFRWYVTGTPFPHAEKSLRAALKFLEVTVDDPSLEYPDGSLQIDKCESINEDFYDQGLFLYPLHNVIYNHLYVRNTKSSIGLDYDVPEYIEELILLTMGDVERGIYERSISELERRQLCCHLQIAARIQNVAGVQQKTLDEVRVALVDQTRRDIERTHKLIENIENDIKTAKEEKQTVWEPQKKTMIQGRITRLQDSIKRQNEEMTKHESALSYFESIVPRINHDVDEPCVICLETIERLTVTPCGHLYCRKCILQCLQAQGQCPTCRKAVHENQLIEVKDAQGRNELVKSAELKNLTETYGTKMAYLIFYLRNLFAAQGESRVIIFSQWDSLLQKIGDTLNENSIKNVFVKGNVHVRNKAIMSFRKQEKTRVIMLSLQNAASGTNLVEATHVVLIDPVAGSPEEAIAIESQAIGRAHRMGQDKQISVVRMIMKDTIEHELYKRNSAEDSNIQQVDFDFEHKGAFGGPQISRRTRTVPEPDPAILQQALQKQQSETTLSAFRGGRGGRRRNGWFSMAELERVQNLMLDVDNYNNDSDDFRETYADSDSFGDSDDEEDGMFYHRRRRNNDCTIS